MTENLLDHGGKLDRNISLYGGLRSDWIDLSTGINKSSYPIPEIPKWIWENLPDESLIEEFQRSARKFCCKKVSKQIVILSRIERSCIPYFNQLVKKKCIPAPSWNSKSP